MQPPNRCPRCGYPLSYDRGGYRCSYCGFPGSKAPLMGTISNIERNLRGKIGGFIVKNRGRERERMTVHYPYGTRPHTCTSCKMQFPEGLQACPYCGARRATPQPLQQNTTPLAPIDAFDQQVLDYIAAHNGTISISQAARDLSMEADTLRLRLERLKSSGMLRTA